MFFECPLHGARVLRLRLILLQFCSNSVLFCFNACTVSITLILLQFCITFGRRLVVGVCEDDTQIHEAFQVIPSLFSTP